MTDAERALCWVPDHLRPPVPEPEPWESTRDRLMAMCWPPTTSLHGLSTTVLSSTSSTITVSYNLPVNSTGYVIYAGNSTQPSEYTAVHATGWK